MSASGTTLTRTADATSLPLALRLARRELRAGLVGFRIFLACLLLGVAAIAGVGSAFWGLVAGLVLFAARHYIHGWKQR